MADWELENAKLEFSIIYELVNSNIDPKISEPSEDQCLELVKRLQASNGLKTEETNLSEYDKLVGQKCWFASDKFDEASGDLIGRLELSGKKLKGSISKTQFPNNDAETYEKRQLSVEIEKVEYDSQKKIICRLKFLKAI